MDQGKEGYFGLPESLFNSILAHLQGWVTAGGPAAAPALLALVALAQSEHAAAVSTHEVRLMDAIFKAIELHTDLEAMKTVPASALPTALLAFQGKLDLLAKFWSGK